MIAECWHCFLIDIVMSDGRSSDAGGRGVVERRWQEKLQIGKKKLCAVHLDEERIIQIVSMSEELGGG